MRVRHLLLEIRGLGPCRAAADLNSRILQRISASRAASAGSRLIACTSAVFNQSDAAGSSETFKVCWNQVLGSLRLRISSPMTYRRWWVGPFGLKIVSLSNNALDPAVRRACISSDLTHKCHGQPSRDLQMTCGVWARFLMVVCASFLRGVPVAAPVRYRGEQELELEEAGAIGQISSAGRTQGRVSPMSAPSRVWVECSEAAVWAGLAQPWLQGRSARLRGHGNRPLLLILRGLLWSGSESAASLF
jgi:hypothetical protein